jgi:hypothetical protein
MKFKEFVKKLKAGVRKADDAIYGDLYALSTGDITQAEYDRRQNSKIQTKKKESKI